MYDTGQEITLEGQARKSLWIETDIRLEGIDGQEKVRLVRACGSKHYRHTARISFSLVRLVRACGSKPSPTPASSISGRVRLVRACGSKQVF